MLNPITPDVYSAQMNTEEYLNHPTFGLLYKICLVEEKRGLFATLYAQRLFFIVLTSVEGMQFDAIGRTDARILLETRLRELRRTGQQTEYAKLQAAHKKTFLQ
jgi:PII interaction protein X